MPPLKTYIFIQKNKSWGEIEIQDYDEISAKWKLETIVKKPNDWELKY